MAPNFEGLVMELLRKHYPPGATKNHGCWTVLEVTGEVTGTIREVFLEEGEFPLVP